MHSHKTLIISCIVVAAVALAAGLLLRDGDDVDNADVTPTPTAAAVLSGTPLARTAAPAPSPRTHTVRLTASGPNPKSVGIRAGDTVAFVNDADAAFWIASDPHPTHTVCPGFDARRGLASGDRYTLIFQSRVTCSYHNHLDPANSLQRGTVIVE